MRKYPKQVSDREAKRRRAIEALIKNEPQGWNKNGQPRNIVACKRVWIARRQLFWMNGGKLENMSKRFLLAYSSFNHFINDRQALDGEGYGRRLL